MGTKTPTPKTAKADYPEDWAKLASKELKDRKLDELVWATPEGFDVKPLYTAADLEGMEAVNSCRVRRPICAV